ncbi:mucosal addressin cell adhesion molecule 1 [Platysternon megacephalum]|uniref:Mucosal addressin cell adhesion molecule 1 n=1 Tax=Platysternon megacephalum TaxID=55544 RepID=A0A4D9EAS2_9SAUR|nr:mucosal addressin cell adhesion molecule 1 [Platysternon megacephalum]
MEQSAFPQPGRVRSDASQCKVLDHRTRASEETCRRWCWCCCSCVGKASNELSVIPDTSVPHRGESEAPQDEHTNLDGTKMEQQVKYVEDKLRSETNARFEGIEKLLRFLEESRRQEAASRIDSCCSRLQKATSKSRCFAQKELSRKVSAEEFHQKEEECEKLKEQKRVLEQKLDLVLSNAMGSHTCSENLNDPCRLSAVLEMYNRLRTHEWEKPKCAASVSTFPMTYEKGCVFHM